ncbi:Lrp/AsnC family transcriptional regulator [Candidatus Woesearchaeota archaeon]|nr:Lrp/AsnC family transcriptional regulator [Candidatus Woesearchaeota archaeon]
MIKLDKKDKKILHQLDINSRQSNSQIAKKVGLSEQVVGYRIKRLVDLGVIDKFITFLNPARIGYTHFKAYMRLQNLSPQIENKLINSIINHPYSFWVVSCRGRWDIIASFFAEDVKRFGKMFRELLDEFDQYIAQRDVVAVEEAPSFTRGYLMPDIERKELEYGGIPEIWQLKKEEIAILDLMSQKSRISLLEIAKKLKISSESVRQKIKKLENEKIIQGYGLLLNFKNVGYELYLVSITLNKLDEQTWNKLTHFARQNKNILFMPKCIGSHDVDFEIEVKNFDEFNQIMADFRTQFNVLVRDFESNTIVKVHKFDYFPMGKELLKQV